MLPARFLGLVLLVIPAASMTAEPIRVSGRVVDVERQSGLAGARIDLFPAYEDDAAAVRRLTEKTGPVPLASARSRADGSFEIAAPESGGFRVTVQAEGYLPVEFPFLPLVENAELPEATLVRGQPLEVQVETTDGRPLAGIGVRLDSPRAGQREESPSDLTLAERKGVSGRDGRLTLLRFPMEPGALTATSPEFLGQSMSSAPGSAAMLRLRPAQAVSIEVRDGDGKPVPSALIRWKGQAVAVAGPDGRCSINVPNGEPPLVTSRQGWWARILPSGGAGIVPIRLQPPRRIAGKVIDLATGRPIAGALVWSGWPLLAPVARTSSAGEFQIELPAGEESWLRAAAAGFLPAERRAIGPGAGEATVLKLAPAAVLSGIVVDTADKPLAGVQIAALSESAFERRRPDWAAAQSRDDGSFRLTGLRVGVYEITARRQGFSAKKVTARIALDRHPSAPLRIVMQEGKSAFGRVVNEAGQPVAGAVVALKDTEGASLEAASGANGGFEFRHLSSDAFYLLARGRGYAYAVSSKIEIPAGVAAFDLGTVTLPYGAAIEGRVTDTRGADVEGAEVVVLLSDYESEMEQAVALDLLGRVRTGPRGNFRLEGLRRGERYEVTVTHPGYVTALAPGVPAPTEEPIRVEMKAARSLSGRVIGPGGEPVAGAQLSRLEELRFNGMMNASRSSMGSTDADGRFRVAGLPAGSIDLEISAEGYETGRLEALQIPEGKDLEGLEISLRRGAVLEVLVLDARGEPVPEITVTAEPEKPPNLASFRFWTPSVEQTDYRGRCRLNVKGHEAYRVTADRGPRSATVRLVPGPGSTSVELRLPAGVEISGRVLGGDGEVDEAVSVHLQGAEGRNAVVPALADGSFLFSDIPDGDYRLRAQSRLSRVSDSLELRIAGQPVLDLELRLDHEGERATLSGRVLGLSPEDLRRVSVTAFSSSEGQSYSARVDAEGEYRLAGLDPGEWTVQARVTLSRLARGTVQIEPGARAATLDLEFQEGGLTLSGHVFVDGAPLVGAMVGVEKQGGANMGSLGQTAWDGGFSLGGLEPGTATLFIFNMSGIGASRTIQLTESKEIAVELASGRLRGTVTAVSGEPVEGAVVTVEALLEENAAFPAAASHSGPDGAFQAARLISGSYRIKVEKEGFAPAEQRAEVSAGEELTVDIRLKPRGAS